MVPDILRFRPSMRRAASMLALLLAACAGQPSMSPQPRPVEPGRLADQRILTADDAAPEWPAAHWWQVFADPQLDRLMALALRDSPSLAQAGARLDLALAATGGARAALLPQLDAGAKLSYERFTELQFIPPPLGGNRFWNNEAMLRASLDLDIWGRSRELLAAARDRGRTAAAEADETREVLLATLARTYVQLAQQEALKRILTETLVAQREIAGLARQRLRAGLGTELELAQAESRLPSSQAELDEIEGAITVTRLQLALLAGQGPAAAAELHEPTLALMQRPVVPDTLPARWLGRRPDVRAQRWQVEALGHEVEAARRAFYPDINLSAFAGHVALGMDDLFSHASSAYGVAPAISLPLFEGGRLQAGLDARQAQRAAAVAAYNGTLLQAAREVVGLSVTLKSVAAQTEAAGQAVTLAARADALARRGLRAGLSDQSHVLDSQLALLNERRRLLQAQARWLDAYIGLARATGGGHDGGVE